MKVNKKIEKSIEERTKQELTNKTKARTIVEDKWERKKYLQECDSDTIKDVIKIRLYIWQVNCNYKRDNTDTKCPVMSKIRKHCRTCAGEILTAEQRET